MKIITTSALKFLSNNVGHCMNCMAASFRACAAASVLLTTAMLLQLPFVLIAALSILTVGTCLLWLAHAAVFSMKTSKRRRARELPIKARRQVLGILGSSMAIAIAPAVLAVAPETAWARSASDHKCYCCAGSSPENCGCDTPESCKDYGRCTMGGNC